MRAVGRSACVLRGSARAPPSLRRAEARIRRQRIGLAPPSCAGPPRGKYYDSPGEARDAVELQALHCVCSRRGTHLQPLTGQCGRDEYEWLPATHSLLGALRAGHVEDVSAIVSLPTHTAAHVVGVQCRLEQRAPAESIVSRGRAQQRRRRRTSGDGRHLELESTMGLGSTMGSFLGVLPPENV